MNAGFTKPLHNSTNPENLVKIRSVVPEIDLPPGRLLRIFLIIKKKASAKYIGRRAGMRGGLNEVR